jgi:hypothetical protein
MVLGRRDWPNPAPRQVHSTRKECSMKDPDGPAFAASIVVASQASHGDGISGNDVQLDFAGKPSTVGVGASS